MEKVKCPLGAKNPDCKTCPYSKEGLCDHPFIKDEKCEAHSE